jgi:Na+-driven multidrug efflux pump
MLTMFVGTTANVVLNFFLIPTMGAEGAVYATLVSFALTTFVLDWAWRATRGNSAKMLTAMITPHYIFSRTVFR